MEEFGGLGLALSVIFGCLFLALLAEVCYLLWWRKRISSVPDEAEDVVDVNTNYSYAKDILHLICLKKPNSIGRLGPSSGSISGANEPSNGMEHDPELGRSKDLLLNSDEKEEEEESVEAELMRLHNLAGPPRFLFTIKEETREDVESDEGRSARMRSLSDLMVGVEKQVSPLKPSPSLNSSSNNDSDSNTGFRFNTSMIGGGSIPPPKFKFLRDAEEKLLRRLMEEGAANKKKRDGFGTLLKIGVVETKHMTSSQVLPLASSPTASFRPSGEKKSASIHRSE